jgi:Flp pilus assembly pilin Flp
MYIKNKKGQSTVEYVLLVTAVIAVMVAFATSQNGGLQGQLNTTMNTVVNDMGAIGNTLSGSHTLSDPGNAVSIPANDQLPV